jgi:hypothetical protein
MKHFCNWLYSFFSIQESSRTASQRAEQAGHSDQQNPDSDESSQHASRRQTTNEQLFAGTKNYENIIQTFEITWCCVKLLWSVH